LFSGDFLLHSYIFTDSTGTEKVQQKRPLEKVIQSSLHFVREGLILDHKSWHWLLITGKSNWFDLNK